MYIYLIVVTKSKFIKSQLAIHYFDLSPFKMRFGECKINRKCYLLSPLSDNFEMIPHDSVSRHISTFLNKLKYENKQNKYTRTLYHEYKIFRL